MTCVISRMKSIRNYKVKKYGSSHMTCVMSRMKNMTYIKSIKYVKSIRNYKV